MFYSKALNQFTEGTYTLLRALTPSITLFHLLLRGCNQGASQQ